MGLDLVRRTQPLVPPDRPEAGYMRIDSREQHYIEAKRRLDFAYGRLSSMDSQILERVRWRRGPPAGARHTTLS